MEKKNLNDEKLTKVAGGDANNVVPVIDKNGCIGCMVCAGSCQKDALIFDETHLIGIKEELCDGCGSCRACCPMGVIS